MKSETVILDACVLYPAPLRDLLMHLAVTGLFRAKWTEEIHDEWIRSILARRPDLTRAQLERTKLLMNEHALDCLVDGYQSLISTLELPDPSDRHVFAAAIHAGASLIVTYNLKDFPDPILKRYDLKPIHPDIFLSNLLEIDSSLVCSAIQRLRKGLKKPPIAAAELYLEILQQQKLPLFCSGLSKFLALI